jgi:hypothetical protein
VTFETTFIVTVLVLIAITDAAFSGFRSSCGRVGLVNRGRLDAIAAGRGVFVLAVAGLILIVALALAKPSSTGLSEQFNLAGRAMLTIYVPFAFVIVLGLLVYFTLSWRHRFLAVAVLLGPLTLLRPLIAIVGLVLAVASTDSAFIRLTFVVAVCASLIVEPTCEHLWYRRHNPQSGLGLYSPN